MNGAWTPVTWREFAGQVRGLAAGFIAADIRPGDRVALMSRVIADVPTPVYGQLARLYKKVTGFPLPPMARGLGLTGIPRPERLYFWFGEPIDTTRFAGRNDDTAARTVRDETKHAVLGGIQFLRGERDRDPDRDLIKRLLRRAGQGTETCEMRA